jgi:hypothetical protein
MKHLKTFESWGMSSKEEMMDYLCNCGYEMSELQGMSEDELQMICDESSPMEESFGMDMGMGKEEMMEYLCRCGYPLKDLMSMAEEDLHTMCMETGSQGMTEKKKEKWIADAIKKPGALRKKMGKKEGEKISDAEIDAELDKLHKKDKDPDKKGDQLSKKDAEKKKQLPLAKTLKGMK